jgi:ATP diphosphatase
VFSLGTLDSGPPQFALSEAEINANWELSKAGERAGKNQHGTFDDVPLHLPALTRAQKIQKRAAREGFDWPDSSGVVAKLREEVEEVERAFEAEGRERQLEELGDVLFSCVNLARHLGADSEALLRHSTNKFQTRFEAMQKTLIARGISTELADPEQLDRAWEDVKAAESL